MITHNEGVGKGKESRLVLGIDPGTRMTGYGLIATDGREVDLVTCGVFKLRESQPLSVRYLDLFNALEELLAVHPIDILCVEGQFLGKNVQSTLKLGASKGVILMTAARHQITVCEYSPSEAKLAATGKGNASKEQVQRMVQMRLKLSEPLGHDVSDALAIAFCYHHRFRGGPIA